MVLSSAAPCTTLHHHTPPHTTKRHPRPHCTTPHCTSSYTSPYYTKHHSNHTALHHTTPHAPPYATLHHPCNYITRHHTASHCTTLHTTPHFSIVRYGGAELCAIHTTPPHPPSFNTRQYALQQHSTKLHPPKQSILSACFHHTHARLMMARIVFVGDAATRITEDYLRILRYFRFHGRLSFDHLHEAPTLQVLHWNFCFCYILMLFMSIFVYC